MNLQIVAWRRGKTAAVGRSTRHLHEVGRGAESLTTSGPSVAASQTRTPPIASLVPLRRSPISSPLRFRVGSAWAIRQSVEPLQAQHSRGQSTGPYRVLNRVHPALDDSKHAPSSIASTSWKIRTVSALGSIPRSSTSLALQRLYVSIAPLRCPATI